MKKLKIGILTYHSERNYGCTLQAFAMQEAYKELGHDPIIIDRYITPDNGLLLGSLKNKNVTSIIKNLLLCVLNIGHIANIKRTIKTLAFHKKYLNKTKYSFYDWQDAPKDLGVDMISVGSDQIWNANLYSPVPYLLGDLPVPLPAISYAASIGMARLDSEYVNEYKEGFSRFKAISIRENQGVSLVEELGFKAKKVLDPTLIVSEKLWEEFKCKKVNKRKKLLCYTIGENLLDYMPILEEFSRKYDCDVVVFPDRYEKSFKKSIKGLLELIKYRFKFFKSPVNLYISAAIKDFLREISSADWVVTNSYHALMFSIIYKRNIRVIVPSENIRKDMHARMEEIAETLVVGPLMQTDMGGALQSIAQGEQIIINKEELQKQRQDSKDWLKNQLTKISEESL